MTTPGTITFLKAVLDASWQGSLVILLILALRPLLGLRVPARWRYLLWTLVLIRLLVPAFILPRSPASLQNIPVVQRPIEHAQVSLDNAYHDYLVSNEMALRIPAHETGYAGQGDAPMQPPASAPSPRHPLPWWKIATGIWLSGAFLFAAWITAATFRFHRRLRRENETLDAAIVRVWKSCGAHFSMKNPPRLLATRLVESPALLGVFRPVLLIPVQAQGVYSADDWEHIFMHELAHFRRRDHWAQALQLLALCAHWFNPLVWLGFRFLRADRELATDELALRRLSGDGDRTAAYGDRATAYGNTLLKVLSGRAAFSFQPGMVGIMENGSQLKQRLQRIVAFGPRQVAGSAVGVALVAILAAVVLGRSTDQPDMSAYPDMKPAEVLALAAGKGDLPAVRRALDDGADMDATTGKPEENKTALVAAASADQMETVKFLLSKGALLNLKTGGNSPALVAALQNGWLDCANFLISKGAVCDPLCTAAAKGNVAEMEKALAGNPDYETLNLACEIAAVNGEKECFTRLRSEILSLPDEVRWELDQDAVVKMVARGRKEMVELMLKDCLQLNRTGWARLSEASFQTPGMHDWMVSKGFKLSDNHDGERLISAVEREDLAEIRRLVKSGVDVNYRGKGSDDWTPLTRAVDSRPKSVKLLLQLGANPNLVRSPGWNFSPLCLARKPEIADMLLAAGADINAKLFGRDVHIIDHCVLYGPASMVEWFIAHGVDPTKVKNDDPSLLFDVRDPGIAEILIKHGVDVNAKDSGGRTAVFLIEQMAPHPAKIVELFLKHGIDPNARCEGGYTLLMAARDGETVDVLIAAGADPNAKDDRGISVVASYVPGSHPSRWEALERHGVKPDTKGMADMLQNAITLRDIGQVKMLLKNIDLNSGGTDSNNFSPLANAISNGRWEIVDILRKAGANDVGLFTEAAAKGDMAQLKTLLAAGADINEIDVHGDTPLFYAARCGHPDAVEFLLAHGANINLFDSIGMTPYTITKMLSWNLRPSGDWSPIEGLDAKQAKAAMDTILALFSKQKLDVNYRNKEGETALIASAPSAVFGVTGAFKDQKIDVNAQRNDGMTALMLAIVNQPRNPSLDVTDTDPKTKETHKSSVRGEFVKSLLGMGADVNLHNKDGKTALDLARENGNEEILALLQQKKK